MNEWMMNGGIEGWSEREVGGDGQRDRWRTDGGQTEDRRRTDGQRVPGPRSSDAPSHEPLHHSVAQPIRMEG